MMKVKLLIMALIVCLGADAQEKWSLRRCVEYALDNNIEIKQREIALDRQEVEVHTAKFKRLPNLGARAGQAFSYGRVASPLDNTYFDRNTRSSSFEVATSVSLFAGGQITHNIALAKLNLDAAMEDLKKVKEDVSMQVTSLFLQVLFAEEISKVAALQLKLSEAQYSRMKRLQEVGKASSAMLYEAKSRAAQDRVTAVQAENNRKLALLDLSQILELSSPEEFAIVAPDMEPTFELLTPPEDIYNIAVVAKPLVRAAQYRVEGAERSIRLAQSALYPQLEFAAGITTGYYTVANFDSPSFSSQWTNNMNKSFGFTLSVPIFNRLETRNKVKTARLQKQNQSFVLDAAKKALFKEIQQAYYSAIAAQATYLSSATAVEAAKESFRLMERKYEEGKATGVEFNEVKTLLQQTTSDRIQAKYDYLFRLKILDYYKGIPIEL